MGSCRYTIGNSKGLIFNEGQIIDASFVLAPKQHNTRDENKDIKNGKGGDFLPIRTNSSIGNQLMVRILEICLYHNV